MLYKSINVCRKCINTARSIMPVTCDLALLSEKCTISHICDSAYVCFFFFLSKKSFISQVKKKKKISSPESITNTLVKTVFMVTL